MERGEVLHIEQFTSPDLSGKRSSRHVALTSQYLMACYVMRTCHGNVAFEMILLV